MIPGKSQYAPDASGAVGYRTDGREIATGYCQRCKAGVCRPETELKRCPTCARDICADCRTFEREIEAYVCLDCATVRRSARKARRRSAYYLLLVGVSALAILVGRFVALRTGWTSVWLLAAVLCAAGIVTFAWQLACHRACPFCEGRAKLRRRKGRFREYECRLCKQAWME